MKEWTTGESFFGELKNGLSFDSSISFCRKLVLKDPFVLKQLKKLLNYEIAVGMNGK
jgi:exosome complex RNA-binding protein Rrp4